MLPIKHRFPTALFAACALVCAVFLSPPSTAAQVASSLRAATLTGQVVDSVSGDPIPGVLIRMDTGEEVFTDARGEFRLDGLRPGRRLFAVLTADCRITWGQLSVVTGIPREVRLRLPTVFGAAAEERDRELEERRRTSGRLYEAEEIDRMGARSMTEVLRRVAPAMVGGLGGAPGETSAIRPSRSRSMVSQDPPVLVIDGVRVPDAAHVLYDMTPSEVETLEVQPGAAAGWEYGSSGASGVIKITLRKGLATGQSTRRRAAPCVVPSFPGG